MKKLASLLTINKIVLTSAICPYIVFQNPNPSIIMHYLNKKYKNIKKLYLKRCSKSTQIALAVSNFSGGACLQTSLEPFLFRLFCIWIDSCPATKKTPSENFYPNFLYFFMNKIENISFFSAFYCSVFRSFSLSAPAREGILYPIVRTS